MDHTIALIQKSHEGDANAKAQLVEENAGLVWCVVRRFYNRGAEAEDLFQIGNIGLLKAIDKFDLSYQVRFSTYAVPMITGEIRRFLRDDGMIKVSRSLKELSYKTQQAREELLRSLGREPDVNELAEKLQVESGEIIQAMEAAADVESIYRPIGSNEGRELTLVDKLEEKESYEERLIDRIVIGEVLDTLDTTERQIIYLRYYAGKTQAYIGELLGISQVQVSRMEKKSLKKMQKMIE